MTRQKFYETCLLRTFHTAWCDPDNPMYDTIGKLDSIEGLTVKEITMRLQLIGVDNIPMKEDFKKWGVGYLCQLLGFVCSEDDSEFTRQFFSFLKRNRGLYRNKRDRKKFGDVCYFAYIENICKKRDFCENLGTFIAYTFKGEEWFDDFVKVAYSLGLVTVDGTEELFRIKYGKTFGELVSGVIGKAIGENNG